MTSLLNSTADLSVVRDKIQGIVPVIRTTDRSATVTSRLVMREFSSRMNGDPPLGLQGYLAQSCIKLIIDDICYL